MLARTPQRIAAHKDELTMPLSARLSGIFNVREDERPLVVQVFSFSLLLSAGYVLASTVAYALFLSELGVGSLPYIYIVSSAASAFVSFIYLRISERVSLSRMTLGAIVLLPLSVLLLWLALGLTSSRALFFALPIFATLLAMLQYTLFWNLLGRLFTLQQGKRLFGLLGSGDSIATLIAGLLAPVLVALVGTTNLLLLAVAAYAGGLLLFVGLVRRYSALLDEVEIEAEATAGPGPTSLRSRYVLLIFAITAAYVFGTYLVDSIFYIEVEGFLVGADRLASFLGVFSGIQGGLGLMLQLLLTGTILERFGVRPTLVATPLILCLWMMPYALLSGLGVAPLILFGLVTVAYMCLLVADAIDSPAYSLLYQVLPPDERVRVQTLTSGVIDPVAAALTGALLIFLYDVLGGQARHAAYLLLVVVAVWALFGWLLAHEYPAQVQRALRKRLLGGESQLPTERASLELIRNGLRQPHAGTALYALQLLEQTEPATLGELGPSLLEHPAAIVRAEAVRALERNNVRAALPTLLECRGIETDPAVRGALERAIAALCENDVIECVGPSLEAADPVMRVGAMTGLLRSGDMDALMVALETLRGWMSDPDPAVRLLAADALHDAEIPSLYRPILQLMDDVDARVRRRSLQAAARLKHQRLWPKVIELLNSATEREMAVSALAAGGLGALPAIEQAIRQPMPSGPADRARLTRLIRAAGRVEADAAHELLTGLLDVPDFEIHTQVLRALRRGGYRAPSPAVVEELVANEVARATWALRARADLTTNPEPGGTEQAVELLLVALDDMVVRVQRNVFHCLAFGHDARLIRKIEDTFCHAGDDRAAREGRAFAREMVEIQIGNPMRNWIRPLLECPPPLDLLSTYFPQPEMSRDDRLRDLAADAGRQSPWVQACALYWLGTAGGVPAAEAATTGLCSREPIVRETAAWALYHLNPVCPPAVFDLVDDPNPQCADYVLSILSKEGPPMLTTIEKVLALRGVELFSSTPDTVLADLVALLKEVPVSAGQRIFAKGDDGRSMFVIAAGEVRIHDGALVYQYLGEGEVFGEMALLDSAPRSADATANSDTVLLELRQEPFFELLEDYTSVGIGIMQLLTRRLRMNMASLSTARA